MPTNLALAATPLRIGEGWIDSDAGNAFDGNTLTAEHWHDLGQQMNYPLGSIGVDFGTPTVVNEMKVRLNTAYPWSTFVVLAGDFWSYDDSFWTYLAPATFNSSSGQYADGGGGYFYGAADVDEVVTMTFANTTAYRYYKLWIACGDSMDPYLTSIYEFEMYGPEASASAFPLTLLCQSGG